MDFCPAALGTQELVGASFGTPKLHKQGLTPPPTPPNLTMFGPKCQESRFGLAILFLHKGDDTVVSSSDMRHEEIVIRTLVSLRNGEMAGSIHARCAHVSIPCKLPRGFEIDLQFPKRHCKVVNGIVLRFADPWNLGRKEGEEKKKKKKKVPEQWPLHRRRRGGQKRSQGERKWKNQCNGFTDGTPPSSSSMIYMQWLLRGPRRTGRGTGRNRV